LVTDCVGTALYSRLLKERWKKRKKKRRRRRKQIVDGLNEESISWNMEEKALDCTLWKTRCGRGYGPITRQTTE